METATAYVCENGQNGAKKCAFRMGRTILQQPVDHDQLEKLLTTGKTDLLQGFVSNKTHRKFSAFLKLDSKGKVSFEFEDKPVKRAGSLKGTPRADEAKPGRRKS